MPEQRSTLILKNAHVLDPSQGIDGRMDVVIKDGKIAAVGKSDAFAADETMDLYGAYLSPGWIDIHVHVYGTLGFADPDSIGLFQGVTSYVEAGGPGIGSLDQFVAMLGGRTRTDLYVGAYLRPMGLIGLNYVEGAIRSYNHVPIEAWLDFAEKHPGLIRYLKVGAFEQGGAAPIHLAKGVAEMLGVPMYVHVGELTPEDGMVASYDAFRIAQAGDIITHIYNGNVGGVLDGNDEVLAVVREAEARGVLFDIGFGGYNFSWHVAEKAHAQGLIPHIISSDLQQFNIGGPTFSLAHVMSYFLHLGMPVAEIIRRVTMAPARALQLANRAGSLRRGMPADITVFRIEDGRFELADAFQNVREADRRFVPVMAFKNGERFDCDFDRALDERNWFPLICEDHVPAKAQRLSPGQAAFLRALHAALSAVEWTMMPPSRSDLVMAEKLQGTFHAVRNAQSIALHDALTAVYDSFLEEPFSVQIGLFLLRMEKSFVLERIAAVHAMQRAEV